MPELPEVETVCRGLQLRIRNKRLQSVELRRKNLRTPFPPALSKLKDVKVKSVTRRAKYVLVNLDNDQTLVIHLGMSGRLLIIDPGTGHTNGKHDHVVFHFDKGLRIIFNDARRFGIVAIAETAALEEHKLFSHLGPEPFDPAFDAKYLTGKLQSKKKTALKVAIMDQEVVVGVGNIYASEALFMAKLDPEMPAAGLVSKDAARFIKCIRAVLEKAIEAGGSSLRDYVQTDGELGYFQHHFAVYGREGKRCPGCTCSKGESGAITKITQGGRSTYFCPYKQKQDHLS